MNAKGAWRGMVAIAAVLAGCSSAGAGGGDVVADDAQGDVLVSDAPPTGVCPEGEPAANVSGKTVVSVTVDGMGPYRMMLDTGAPQSIFSSAVVSALPSGALHTVHVAGRDVSLGRLRTGSNFGVPGLDGVLGTDVVGSFALTFDFRRGRFWLDEVRDDAALAACDVEGDAAVVPFVTSDYLYVRGTMESERGWYLLDTGASLGAVPQAVYGALQADRARVGLQGFYTPAAVGTFWARLFTVRRMEVGGLAVQNLLARSAPDGLLPAPTPSDGQPMLGVLPSDYLRRFLMTVDFPASQLRLQFYRGEAHEGTVHRLAIGIGLEETTTSPVHIAQVVPGSPAEASGFQVGDEVTRVRSTSFAGLLPYDRPWALVTSTDPGATEVAIVRNGVPMTLTTRYADILSVP